MDSSFLAFLGVSAVVIVTPGQDTALTIRNALAGGRRGGIGTAFGVATGQSCWTLAASLGLTALLVASEPAFAAVRLLGAAYLVWLGWHSIRAAIRGHGPSGARDAAWSPGLGPAKAWRQGLLSSLGNPKLAVFFSSLLPPFVPAGAAPLPAMLGLGAVFVAMTLAWLSGYAVVIARLGDRMRGGRIRRAFDAITGTVLMVVGGRLALERRGS
jgi:threonine/homoserine/homoserine lactone efflux protein